MLGGNILKTNLLRRTKLPGKPVTCVALTTNAISPSTNIEHLGAKVPWWTRQTQSLVSWYLLLVEFLAYSLCSHVIGDTKWLVDCWVWRLSYVTQLCCGARQWQPEFSLSTMRKEIWLLNWPDGASLPLPGLGRHCQYLSLWLSHPYASVVDQMPPDRYLLSRETAIAIGRFKWNLAGFDLLASS